jgi:hypothetical protein
VAQEDERDELTYTSNKERLFEKGMMDLLMA